MSAMLSDGKLRLEDGPMFAELENVASLWPEELAVHSAQSLRKRRNVHVGVRFPGTTRPRDFHPPRPAPLQVQRNLGT